MSSTLWSIYVLTKGNWCCPKTLPCHIGHVADFPLSHCQSLWGTWRKVLFLLNHTDMKHKLHLLCLVIVNKPTVYLKPGCLLGFALCWKWVDAWMWGWYSVCFFSVSKDLTSILILKKIITWPQHSQHKRMRKLVFFNITSLPSEVLVPGLFTLGSLQWLDWSGCWREPSTCVIIPSPCVIIPT